jgi:hypothetical protein
MRFTAQHPLTADKMAIASFANDTSQPGRSCPLHYRYSPQDLARAPDFHADTLYVIGGLYGNMPALDAVLQLAAREHAPATLVFNGDFNWFNIDARGFHAINDEVLRHHALRGNVETEIADDDESAGCGCGYPDWVGDGEVERSNAIILNLRDTARCHPDLRSRLATLPMHRVAEVGDVRVAIVHGDLESLSGWALSQEILAADNAKLIVQKQIVASGCRIVASSHTCLPVAVRLETSIGPCGVFNNGAAGMPNFRATHFGVITRIATTPAVQTTLYGTRLGGVYVDALSVHYDQQRWHNDFLRMWPPGSAAHASYYRRITAGPAYNIEQAARLAPPRPTELKEARKQT